jgi:hypothetical protein
VQSKTISFRHRRPLLYATTWAWLCRPGCVVAWTWAYDMVLQLMLPLLVGLINVLEYMIKSVLHPAQHPDLVKHRRAAVISKYLAFINCLYMTLVRYSVGAFVCINLTADGTLMVLKADPNIECYSPTHNALMAVAVVGVVLYTVGYARPNLGCYCFVGSVWPRARAASWSVSSWVVQLPGRYRHGALYDRQAAGAQLCAEDPTVWRSV